MKEEPKIERKKKAYAVVKDDVLPITIRLDVLTDAVYQVAEQLLELRKQLERQESERMTMKIETKFTPVE